MTTKQTLIAVAAALLAIGCKQPGADSEPTAAPAEGGADTIALATTTTASAPATEEESYFDRVAAKPAAPKPAASTAAASAPKAAAKSSAASKQAETIYVETDGAQGRVWGHVTMRGDRGTGTIHDWDENTLSVSVTRHGDELFAVDQNSRQYVFKVRK